MKNLAGACFRLIVLPQANVTHGNHVQRIDDVSRVVQLLGTMQCRLQLLQPFFVWLLITHQMPPMAVKQERKQGIARLPRRKFRPLEQAQRAVAVARVAGHLPFVEQAPRIMQRVICRGVMARGDADERIVRHGETIFVAGLRHQQGIEGFVLPNEPLRAAQPLQRLQGAVGPGLHQRFGTHQQAAGTLIGELPARYPCRRQQQHGGNGN